MTDQLQWRKTQRDGRVAVVRMSDRRHGDLCVRLPEEELEARRQAFVASPWTWLHQVHGSDVVVVEHPGQHAGAEADASFTAVSGAALVAHAADCAPVAMVAENGLVGVAHAGWRGLEAGVLGTLAGAMRKRGAVGLEAVLGPCIHAECYEFGVTELERLSATFGSSIVGTTKDGKPALDMPVAVGAALALSDVPLVSQLGGCTACEADLRWSHRARTDPERQAMVAVLEPARLGESS